MDSDIDIVKDFLGKMSSQSNRGTAFPYYYVIRTEVVDHAPLENCDEVKIYYDCDTYESMDELEITARGHGESEDQIKKILNEACEYGIKKRWDKRGMFLTEEDAESHLKLNHYHYSPNAHTYVEHAWRAPRLKAFLEALNRIFIEPKE